MCKGALTMRIQRNLLYRGIYIAQNIRREIKADDTDGFFTCFQGLQRIKS